MNYTYLRNLAQTLLDLAKQGEALSDPNTVHTAEEVDTINADITAVGAVIAAEFPAPLK
jgi:hypothetical protein